MKVYGTFPFFSGLRHNKSRCEAAGGLKGAKLTLCDMNCIDLRLNTIKILGIHFSHNNCIDLRLNAIKILGIHFSYNMKIENDKNFLKHITSIEGIWH